MFDAHDTGASAGVAFDVDAAIGGAEHRRVLACAACRHAVTRTQYATVIAGGEVHTRTNPHGHAYTVRLFTQAPGCHISGVPTAAHTWFPPCAWQLAHCAGCGEHLGWRFAERAGGYFFALISARLREECALD